MIKQCTQVLGNPQKYLKYCFTARGNSIGLHTEKSWKHDQQEMDEKKGIVTVLLTILVWGVSSVRAEDYDNWGWVNCISLDVVGCIFPIYSRAATFKKVHY